MDNRHWRNMLVADIVAARNAGVSTEEIHDIVASALNMVRHLPNGDNTPSAATTQDDGES